MNTITPIRLILFVLFMSGQLQAQTYHFSVENETYEPIQGGQDLVGGIWNDPQLTIPIGFDFDFYNNTTAELTLPSFFSIVSILESQEPISSVFILFGADLIDRGFIDGVHLSTIRSSVTGSAGSRVFTLEWDNAGFYAELFVNGTSTNHVSFQMKLYEENGDIVFHFGPNSVPLPDLAYGGFGGAFMGIAEDFDLANDVVNGEIILLSGDPLDPDLQTDYAEYTLEATIPENTLYRFSREPVSAVDPVAEESGPYYSPNPASGIIRLNERLLEEVISPVDVYDINGRLMQRCPDKTTCDLSDLGAGMYELRFECKKRTRMERIVVLPD